MRWQTAERAHSEAMQPVTAEVVHSEVRSTAKRRVLSSRCDYRLGSVSFTENVSRINFHISAPSSNKRWASKRAQPKKDFSKLLLELQAKKCGRSTINCEGMQRIETLAKPRSRYMKCKAKPSSRNYHSCCLECSTDRILKLSEPRLRVDLNNHFRPLSSILKVSESAKAYEGECEFPEKQNFLSESHNDSV